MVLTGEPLFFPHGINSARYILSPGPFSLAGFLRLLLTVLWFCLRTFACVRDINYHLLTTGISSKKCVCIFFIQGKSLSEGSSVPRPNGNCWMGNGSRDEKGSGLTSGTEIDLSSSFIESSAVYIIGLLIHCVTNIGLLTEG